jgi:hypothetical protein
MKLSVCLALSLILLPSASVSAQSTETAGGQIVIGADQFTPGNLKSGTYYNPSGIVVGSKFYMYVQGGQFNDATAPWRSCDGDQILLFSAPNTHAGLRGRFAPGTIVGGSNARISPCETDTGNGSDGNPTHTNSPIFSQKHHYTAGQVFYDGNYRIISAASNYPGANDFTTLILGSSSDGVKWHWEQFIHSTSGVGMAEMALQAGLSRFYCDPDCFAHTAWWGFFRIGFSGTGLIKVDVSQKYPRGFRVWIYATDSTWKQVDDLTGDYGFTPQKVWPGVVPKAINYNVDHYELWATSFTPHNGCSPCTGSYCNGFAGTTFSYRTVDSVFNLGPVQSVFSAIRCMPSDYSVGRHYPFRYNDPNAKKLLYSATNDRNICDPNICSNVFVGMYVVVTVVDK